MFVFRLSHRLSKNLLQNIASKKFIRNNIIQLAAFSGYETNSRNRKFVDRSFYYMTFTCLGSGALIYYFSQLKEGNFTVFAANNDPPVKKSALREFIDEKTSIIKKKLDNLTLPEHVPYVLIGGGTASYYAALTIRAYDANAKILIISNERETPYNRGPLSKDLFLHGTSNVYRTLEYISAAGKKRDIRYESDGFFLSPGTLQDFEHGGVSLLRNTTAIELDPVAKHVVLESGKTVKFDKCLIATGEKPIIPFPFYSPHLRNKVMTYYGVSDFQKLSLIVDESDSILVFGDDILAAELTYALSVKFGKKLKVVYAITKDYPLQSIFPSEIAEPIESTIKSGNVELLSRVKPIAVDKLPNGKVSVIFNRNGETQRVVIDHIVVAHGMEPCVKIAKNAGLVIDEKLGGIVADSKLQTSAADIYVAGDVATYQDPLFGLTRIERWENAEITGRLAGQNMAGNIKEFHHRPAFVSKFGQDLHLSGIGQIDSSLKTISVFTPKENSAFKRGVVFYIKENKVVGVLLFNIFGVGIEIARKIIADSKEIRDVKEFAKLFDIYEPRLPEEKLDDSAVEEEKKSLNQFQ